MDTHYLFDELKEMLHITVTTDYYKGSNSIFHNVQIVAMDDGEDQTDLGQMKVVVFDHSIIPLRLLASGHSDDAQTAFDDYLTKYVKDHELYRYAYFDEIVIHQQFRQNGIGSLALKTALYYFISMGIDVFLLTPYPFMESSGSLSKIELKNKIDGLVQFYERNGFRVINGNREEPSMVLWGYDYAA